MKNNGLLGKTGLFLTAMIWGSGFTFSALALEHFTTLQLIAMRFTIAFIALLVMNFHRLKRIRRADLIRGSFIGVILFLSYVLQTMGLEYTTTSKNSFLSAVYVVLVPIIAWIIGGEKISKNAMLGAVISLVGIQLTSLSGLEGEMGLNIGDILTLLSAAGFAGHLYYTDRYGKAMSAWMLMIIQMGVAASLSWITAIFLGEAQFEITAQGMMPVLYVGLVATLLSYGLQTVSQRYTTSGESAVILSTEAFFGLLTAMVILGEPLLLNMIIGGIMIFAGILVVELKPIREADFQVAESIETANPQTKDIV